MTPRTASVSSRSAKCRGAQPWRGAADSDASQACRKSKETNGSPVEEAQASHASRPMSAIRS